MALSKITTNAIDNSAITDSKIASLAASKLTGQVADANAPSGSVVQIVQQLRSSGGLTTTSSSFVATGFKKAITLQASTSILVLMDISGIYTNSRDHSVGFAIYRNGTLWRTLDTHLGYGGTGAGVRHHMTSIHLDADLTVGQTYEYELYWGVVSGGTTAGVFDSHFTNSSSTITLMEIIQ